MPEHSSSRALGDIVEAEWRSAHPDSVVTSRHVGTDPVPATAWAAAVSAGGGAAEDRSPAQAEAVALATTYADELLAADALLFAVPLYNYGVSQHFKSWVDMVITDPRIGTSGGDLAGRPAVLATVIGGNYAPGSPKEGWDHATGWMRRILEDVWRLDVRVVKREFTLVGVNPALDAFADIAHELRVAAEDQAREHGRSLASTRTAAA